MTTYNYPVQGIHLFLRNQSLRRLTTRPLLVAGAVALVVTVTLLNLTLHQQEKVLHHIGLPATSAWFFAVLFVVIEAVTGIFGLLYLELYKEKLFAHVLAECGHQELVEDEEKHASTRRMITSCLRVSILMRMVLLVASLPLNAVPALGSVVYAWLNGMIMAWEAHLYYFRIKDFGFIKQRAVITQHKLEYSVFGVQAMLLEMIPVAGVVFMFTDAIGAALFAAKIEEELEKQKHNKNSICPWGTEKAAEESYEKIIDMVKVPLLSNIGGYVPPYSSATA